MTTQLIVEPSKIEEELQKIWEGLSKENKIRASVFNLIVFNRLSSRSDYFRNIVQKVVEKFPCRILFLSEDAQAAQPYLKTAISVVTPQEIKSIACDQIDIGFSTTNAEKIPLLLLPHILADLPVYLLWAEDPVPDHSLLLPLLKLTKRVIFDSESANDLRSFAQKLLSIHEEIHVDIADLNWARTGGWRNLIASLFDTEERLDYLFSPAKVKICYNARTTPFFCHLKIQSLYLLAWLAKRLQWKFQNSPNEETFSFEGPQGKIEGEICNEEWDHLGPGTVISFHFESTKGASFKAARIRTEYHRVKVEITTQEKCELPFQFLLGKTASGQSLVQEICTKGTSSHFLETLQEIVHGLC